MLVFTLKLEHTFIVGVSTGLRAISRDRESMPRMQHAVQQLVDRTIEDSLDKQIFGLFTSQAVAVSHKTAPAVDLHQLRLAVDVRSECLGEIVLHPHIVIARKVVYFNAFLMQFLKKREEGGITSRHDVAIFEPEIEDVAQEK